jgi:flagellar basal-body rod protein FlgG
MGREIYSGMSGGIRALSSLDTLSNNLANINTTGFKADRPTFSLRAPAHSKNIEMDSAEGRLAAAFSVLDGQATDYSQGSLRDTGGRTDLAIKGDGFFRVADEDGKVHLTRDGSFQLSPEGTLITRDGFKVQSSTGGNIQVGGEGELVISEEGQVRIGEEVRGQIAVVDIEDRTKLSKVGGNRWAIDEDTELKKGTGAIAHRFLEASNVQPVRALTELIAVSRYYEAFQKGLEASGKLDDALNTQVGRINQ